MNVEAMKRWLASFEGYRRELNDSQPCDAEKELRQAIEQAEQQEPRNIRERWNIELDGDDLLVCFNDHERGEKCRYERYVLADTSPPQRTEQEPLTENEIKHLWYEACQTNLELTSQLIVHLARNIEAAHGIKGEA